jgi:hypothetical protein
MRMQRWLVPVLVLVLSMLWTGCLGTLEHDQDTQHIVEAPRTALSLPVHSSRPHWLLRSQTGWVGSHEVELGGTAEDPGYAAIRAARFRDVETATQAYMQLTPDYIYRLYRKRMNSVVYPFVYPLPLPGDATSVMAYEVRLPPEVGPDVRVVGQMTTIRAGMTVILIESIGIPPEQLVPAITELISTARRIG